MKRADIKWKEVFNALTDAAFIQDTDFTIVEANKAFIDMLKKRPEEIIGKKCYELLHGSDKLWPSCPFEKTKEDALAHSEEVDDPNIGIPLLVTTSPLFDDSGNLIGSLHIAKDISQQHKVGNVLKEANSSIKLLAEELKAKNTDLQKLDQLKSDFVSTVSHELRTPLSITKEGISLVLDKITGAINEKQEKILTTAKDNIDRLARIINDLLDISKIESRKVELKKDLVNISDIIRDIMLSFRASAQKKGIEIKVALPKDNIEVYADRDKMIQVFTNLIANALKFTEKGYVELAVKDGEKEVECVIRDTGKGMSKEDLPKVFDKFQQFGRVAGPGDKGTGLGLSIVKAIVQMHNGAINVESELDAGTSFVFTLPKYSADFIFKEYAEAAIRKADSKNSHMSLFVVSIDGFEALKKKLPLEKIRSIVDGIKLALKRSLRGIEDAVAKDTCEIIVVLPDCDKENALNVKNRLERVLKEHMENKGLSQVFKLSIGSSTYPADARVDKDLIDIARRK